MVSWPTYMQVNIPGYDNNVYEDIDDNGDFDRLLPTTAVPNYVNIYLLRKLY